MSRPAKPERELLLAIRDAGKPVLAHDLAKTLGAKKVGENLRKLTQGEAVRWEGGPDGGWVLTTKGKKLVRQCGPRGPRKGGAP